ncbi:MAG: hypothetical protein ACKOEZ_06330, partial [Spartobacteria bacterium]
GHDRFPNHALRLHARDGHVPMRRRFAAESWDADATASLPWIANRAAARGDIISGERGERRLRPRARRFQNL